MDLYNIILNKKEKNVKHDFHLKNKKFKSKNKKALVIDSIVKKRKNKLKLITNNNDDVDNNDEDQIKEEEEEEQQPQQQQVKEELPKNLDKLVKNNLNYNYNKKDPIKFNKLDSLKEINQKLKKIIEDKEYINYILEHYHIPLCHPDKEDNPLSKNKLTNCENIQIKIEEQLSLEENLKDEKMKDNKIDIDEENKIDINEESKEDNKVVNKDEVKIDNKVDNDKTQDMIIQDENLTKKLLESINKFFKINKFNNNNDIKTFADDFKFNIPEFINKGGIYRFSKNIYQKALEDNGYVSKYILSQLSNNLDPNTYMLFLDYFGKLATPVLLSLLHRNMHKITDLFLPNNNHNLLSLN